MLAVDWGGTWCRAALVDRRGDILWGDRRTNPRGGDMGQYLALANALLAEALAVEGIRGRRHRRGGGRTCRPRESGILYQPPNLMALDGVSLKQEWSERFGLPVVLGNDANLAAMGEYHYGAGRDAVRSGHPLEEPVLRHHQHRHRRRRSGGGGICYWAQTDSPQRWDTRRSIPPGMPRCASAESGDALRPSPRAPPSPTSRWPHCPKAAIPAPPWLPSRRKS